MQYLNITSKIGFNMVLTVDEEDKFVVLRRFRGGDSRQQWRLDRFEGGDRYYLIPKSVEKKLQVGPNLGDQAYLAAQGGGRFVIPLEGEGSPYAHIQDVRTDLALCVGPDDKVIGCKRIITDEQLWKLTVAK